MKKLLAGVYFAGILAEMVLRIPYNRQRRKIPKSDQRVTPAEKGLLGGLFTSMFMLPLLYGLTRRLDFADYPLSPTASKRAGGLGAAFLAAAVGIFWRAHVDLGSNWSPSLEIGEKHQLITRGIYGWIRHPMYASQVLWSIAQTLLLQNWIAGVGAVAGYLPLFLVRIPAEERMMEEHFGEAYRAYREHTGGIVPKLPG